MLQFSSSPITPRPRPPRSRSSQLSSGSNLGATAGTTTSSSILTAATPVDEDLCKQITSLVAVAGAGSEVALDTPPYTPELPLYEGYEREGPDERHRAGESEMQPTATRTAKELEDMLAGAQRVIRDREKDLGIAASIGKTLLETNNALRAKQDALLARVQLQPTSATLQPRQRGLAVVSPPSAYYRDVKPSTASGIPFSISTSKGESVFKPPTGRSEYIETLPPPSPRSSLDGSQGRYRYREASSVASDNNDRDAWTDEERCDNTSISPVALRRRQGLTGASPRSSRHARNSHSRSSSISSAVLIIGPSANTSVTPSRSGSDRNLFHASLSTPLQLQQQHAALAAQNAELERKLYELEYELDQADNNGKRKLRRLDKELGHLQTELEAALERNRELEERLGRAKSSTGSATTASTFSFDSGASVIREIRATPEHDDAWLEDQLLPRIDDEQQPTTTDTDADVPECETTGPSIDLPTRHALSVSMPRLSSSPAGLSRHASVLPSQASADPDIVRQLLSKISELETTNAAMARSREQLVARMQKASSEAQEIREQYEALEDRMTEAEMRDRERAMQQIGFGDPDTQPSPTSSLQRKAIGNRCMIERHRRLSSMCDMSQDLSPSSTPAKSERSNSITSARRAGRHGGLSRSVSAASSFFQSDDWEAREATRRAAAVGAEEDIFEAMKRGAAADQSLLRRSQHLLGVNARSKEQEDTDEPEETSADWRRLYNLKLDLGSASSVTASDDGQSILHGLSPSNSLRVLGHGQHTLASELDGLWHASTSFHVTTVPQSHETLEQTTSGTTLAIVHHAESASSEAEAYDTDHGVAMPAGPPDAESYDALQASLCDVPIAWADDEPRVSRFLLLKDVANRNGLGSTGAGCARQTASAGRHGSLKWVYDDTSDGSDENDPWREEEEAKTRSGSLAIESSQDVGAREQADDKAARRRQRLQELARAISRDDNELENQDANTNSDSYLEKRLAALRTIGSDEELRKLDAVKQIQLIAYPSDAELAPSSSSPSLTEYHQVSSDTRAPGSAGTDYWPVDLRARYAPSMVAMRIQTTSKEYLNLILLWSRFLVVLAVAVAFSLWRGPKAALGLDADGDAPPKRRQLASQGASAPQERPLLTRPSRVHLGASSPGKEKQC